MALEGNEGATILLLYEHVRLGGGKHLPLIFLRSYGKRVGEGHFSLGSLDLLLLPCRPSFSVPENVRLTPFP